MVQRINTLKWIQGVLRACVREGDVCIDATMGRGFDTAFLCELVGESGRVLAFDIQEEALASTEALLRERGIRARAALFCAGHEGMAAFARAESVAAVVFNLGYLPGGDHRVATGAATTIAAIEAGLGLLRADGVMTLAVYHGGDSGFAERDAVLAYVRGLDHRQFTVMVTDFYNRPNHPPLAVVIVKGQ